MPLYDVIVLGAGGVGSAAMMHLARRGARVLGLDQFAPPHDRGSSHGQSRIIRQAYFEHSNYVPLVLESYRMWEELEELTTRNLYHEIGLVEIGPSDGIVVPNVLRAADEHQLAVESLSADDAQRRWPGLRIPEDLDAVFEQQAGYLLVEACIASHLEVAARAGAELRTNTKVHGWTADENEVTVHTHDGAILGKRLVVAAGAWSDEILQGLQLQLMVRRKSLFWFRSDAKLYDDVHGLPVFLFEVPAGIFYGTPNIDQRGVKVGEHSGGQPVDDPHNVDRTQLPSDRRLVGDFVQAHLPGVSDELLDHTVCMYTMTNDEHFVIDHHPQYENVIFAAGLSGHGFKFTPVLGQALADLALEGSSQRQIDFLSLSRFA